MRKIIISFAAFVAFALGALAQSSISVQVPSVVSVDEQFNIVFSIEGDKPTDFSWEVSPDFSLLWGPQQGRSTSVSIVNGKRTDSSTTSYTYVLQPTKTGTFVLPVATAKIKGKTISSRSAEIKVVAGSSAGSSASSSSSSSASSATGGVSSEDLFLRLNLSKRKVMVGESITAELKLYQRVNIAGFEDVHFPSFDGFWSQELQAPSNVEFVRESVGEVVYNAAVLRSYTLIAQQSGEITIDPAELTCLVNVRTNRSTGNSLFDAFFESDYQTIRRKVATKPVTVKVSALPQPAPASFCGAVGSFKVESYLTKDSLGAHDAASLIVKVTGNGNLMLVDAPKISFPPDFESYDPKTTDGRGVRTFEYPFIPRSAGSFTVAPVEFSYFDLGKSAYATIRTSPMPITVSRGAAGAQTVGGAQSFVGVAGRDVKDIGSDVRFIATKHPKAGNPGNFFVWSVGFFAILALLVCAAVALFVVVRKLRANRSDVARTRTKGASKVAQRRLSQAGFYLKDNLYSAFYQELHKALLGFAADKLNIDAAQQDKENIKVRLSACGASEADVAEFIGLLDACEFARYSPTESHDQMEAHYNDSLRVISSLDSSMKHSHNKALAAVAVLLMLPVGLQAAQWEDACAAYSAGSFEEALSTWKAMEASGEISAELYYNIGCACFKLGDLSHSVIYFERALKVEPSYEDASVNLAFVRTYLQDRIEAVPEFFLVGWARGVRNSMSSDSWAVLFVVLFALLLVGLLVFGLGRSSAARKTGFFAAVVLAVFAIVAVCNASAQKKNALSADEAVVVSGVSAVRSAPDSQTGTDLFILHEGAKVKVLDSIGAWKQISLTDGRQGWIASSEIETI